VGKWVDQGPPCHTILGYDKNGELIFEWEVLFVALDTPKDVRKLLSMELVSDAWINEAREVPKVVLDGLTGRVGRYPQTIRENPDDVRSKVLFGCHKPQIMLDTNPPDTDHWWYIACRAGHLDAAQRRHLLDSMAKAENELRRLGHARRGPAARRVLRAALGAVASGREQAEPRPRVLHPRVRRQVARLGEGVRGGQLRLRLRRPARLSRVPR
jgi:hypothetical protein